MNNILKILIGLIVLLIGIWTMIDPAWFGQTSMIYGLGWWSYTWDIIRGAIGPMLILIGIIVIWITYEESKV
ncbi:MAG: hypothetical protein MUO26_15950 [Methanotrichaceae archaeon]|nr:hypothetical protein [Methanotrichaceae archaeon]